jgi:thioredoxin 1
MTVTVFQFWSDTCGPCRVIKPSLEALQEDFEGQIEWISINTKQDAKGVARLLNVTLVPTLVVVRDGMEVGRITGTQVALMYTLIRKALAMGS